MKRLSVILASVVLLSGVSVAVVAGLSASASPARDHVGPLSHRAPRVASHGVIAGGETWTIYDTDLYDYINTCDSNSVGLGKCTSSNEGAAFCEKLTFGAHATTFTGNMGDSGTTKKNVMLTFAANAGGLWTSQESPVMEMQFNGKYDPNLAEFLGSITYDGYVVGAAILAEGADPLGAGDCFGPFTPQ